jgi:hypothetical protein
VATTDAAPLRLQGTNLAAYVRERLAEARERGEGFDSAWHGALAALPLEAPDRERADQRRERECWLAALRWARPAFHRAYRREGAEGAEDAAVALAEVA